MTDTGTQIVNVVYVILGLAPFLLLLVRRACTRWDRKNDLVYEALRSPTVREARNAFDRRVALAIREAKQRTRECQACGFANATRVVGCVLCGTPMALKKPRRRLNAKRKQQRHGDDAANDVPSDTERAMTSRQRRARYRREWTRRVDQGRVVWTRDEALKQEPVLATFQAYVLRTTRLVSSPEVVPASEQEPSPASPPALRPESPSSEDHRAGRLSTPTATQDAASEENDLVAVSIDEAAEVPAPTQTIEDVAGKLHAAQQALAVEMVPAADADASLIAFSTAEPTPQTTQACVDTVLHAHDAFPTKLADFITSLAAVFHETSRTRDANERVISRFEIHRDTLLSESIAALATLSAAHARAAIRVDFVGERGVDAGGVYREWFLLLNEEIVESKAGIFVCVDPQEQTFYLNPHSQRILGEHHGGYFLAAGRLVGRALLEGNVTGFHLALPLLKLILGQPVSVGDLEHVDPEAYKNLLWLLANDGVDMLGLDFTVVKKTPDGAVRVVELVPGGSAIDVTDANKHAFVDAKLRYSLVGSVEPQLRAFLTGVYEVVPAELLLRFDAVELDLILSGADALDVDDWEAHTVTSRNMALHPAYFNFWKCVRELSPEEQRRLLQFATGATRVPPGGFAALTSHDGRLCLFSLHGVPPDATWGCIHAHACFNRLDLPMVRDLGALRAAVRAVVDGDAGGGGVVGFTTV